eukprot:1123688-Pyramimonas_sp.AAC.1
MDLHHARQRAKGGNRTLVVISRGDSRAFGANKFEAVTTADRALQYTRYSTRVTVHAFPQ